MSEIRERLFTHDEVYMVGGEYYKSKETNEWVSETQIDQWRTESINIEIKRYYDEEQDKYY